RPPTLHDVAAATSSVNPPASSGAAPVSTNPFGTSMNHAIPFATRMDLAHQMGVRYYRETASLYDDGVRFGSDDPDQVRAAGFEIVLNVRYYGDGAFTGCPAGAGTQCEEVAPDLDRYAELVGQAIDRARP